MWAIIFPFCVATWLFFFVVFGFQFSPSGRKNAVRWEAAQRGLRWVCYLCVGYGGLVAYVCLPLWLHWARLHSLGVSVCATVIECTQEYDSEWGRQFTSVTYEFDAEKDGQLRTFRREGELRGIQMLMVPGPIQVLYDPVDPTNSKMVHESIEASEGLGSLASFLFIGIASGLLLRRLKGVNAGQSPPQEKVHLS